MVTRKMLKVTCALICDGERVLAAQRGHAMRHAGQWEFPGGKLEEGEVAEDCIRREILEELGIEIRVIRRMTPSRFATPVTEIELIPFLCEWVAGALHPVEHQQVRWITVPESQELDWLPADVAIAAEWRSLRAQDS